MGKTKTLWVDIKSISWERYSIEVDENESLEEIGDNIWDYNPDYDCLVVSDPMSVAENNGYSTLEIRENELANPIWENGKPN